jgi:hypothetical protein
MLGPLFFRLTSLRQGYGGPLERFARRRKAEATWNVRDRQNRVTIDPPGLGGDIP